MDSPSSDELLLPLGHPAEAGVANIVYRWNSDLIRWELWECGWRESNTYWNYDESSGPTGRPMVQYADTWAEPYNDFWLE